MSILDSFEASDWNNGVRDANIENHMRLKDTYGLGVCAALVVTENCPFYEIKSEFKFSTKYINLSCVEEGEYDRVMEQMPYWTFEGIMLDNIDKIPDNKDTEYWQEFVRFALKKEADFPLNQTSGATCGIIDFDKLHVAARSTSGLPEYLEGKSLQSIIINANSVD